MKDPLGTLPTGTLAVIFISQRDSEQGGYAAMADRMAELAVRQEGFLCWATARDSQELGITVSFWRDRIAALEWKQVAEHRLAQRLGSERWYSRWSLHICTIDESRSFARSGA